MIIWPYWLLDINLPVRWALTRKLSSSLIQAVAGAARLSWFRLMLTGTGP